MAGFTHHPGQPRLAEQHWIFDVHGDFFERFPEKLPDGSLRQPSPGRSCGPCTQPRRPFSSRRMPRQKPSLLARGAREPLASGVPLVPAFAAPRCSQVTVRSARVLTNCPSNSSATSKKVMTFAPGAKDSRLEIQIAARRGKGLRRVMVTFGGNYSRVSIPGLQ